MSEVMIKAFGDPWMDNGLENLYIRKQVLKDSQKFEVFETLDVEKADTKKHRYVEFMFYSGKSTIQAFKVGGSFGIDCMAYPLI